MKRCTKCNLLMYVHLFEISVYIFEVSVHFVHLFIQPTVATVGHLKRCTECNLLNIQFIDVAIKYTLTKNILHNQRTSEVVRGCPRSSEVIHGHLRLCEAVLGHTRLLRSF